MQYCIAAFNSVMERKPLGSEMQGHVLLGVALKPIWWVNVMIRILTKNIKLNSKCVSFTAFFCVGWGVGSLDHCWTLKLC